MLSSTKLWSCILLCASVAIKAQTYNYYFGNIHAHSGYSDGNQDFGTNGKQTPADDFAYAKLSQHFDFLGISEHNHHSSSDLHLTPTLYQQGLQQTAAANVNGTFVCLYGVEYGVISSGGHIVMYGFDQLIGWESGNYDIYNAKLDYNGFFTKVANKPNAFCTLAHPDDPTNPYPVGGSGTSLTSAAYSSIYDQAIVGVPFRSGPAFSTNTNYGNIDYSDYTPYYNMLLAKGYRVGMSYDHDTHNLTFGRHTPGRVVVLAPTLTQASIIDGFMNMRFYGSDDWNAKVNYTISGKPMGSTVNQNSSPQISVVHNDGDNELAKSIKIYAGTPGSNQNPVLLTSVSNNNTLLYTDNSLSFGNTRYYYVRIEQADGDDIVTSPIWYTNTNTVGIETHDNAEVWSVFPNPVSNQLSIATEFTDRYTVEVIDLSGRTVLSQQFESATGSLDMSALAKGFYTLMLHNGNRSFAKKIVVE